MGGLEVVLMLYTLQEEWECVLRGGQQKSCVSCPRGRFWWRGKIPNVTHHVSAAAVSELFFPLTCLLLTFVLSFIIHFISLVPFYHLFTSTPHILKDLAVAFEILLPLLTHPLLPLGRFGSITVITTHRTAASPCVFFPSRHPMRVRAALLLLLFSGGVLEIRPR